MRVASLIAQLVKNLPAMQERPWFDFWGGNICWRRGKVTTAYCSQGSNIHYGHNGVSPLPTDLKWSEIAQSCLTLCDPVDCSPPGSSVHGFLQARILEWIVISFSRESSRPRDRTHVSRIADRHFNLWATREALTDLVSHISVCFWAVVTKIQNWVCSKRLLIKDNQISLFSHFIK